jgi:hypothetical protein
MGIDKLNRSGINARNVRGRPRRESEYCSQCPSAALGQQRRFAIHTHSQRRSGWRI